MIGRRAPVRSGSPLVVLLRAVRGLAILVLVGVVSLVALVGALTAGGVVLMRAELSGSMAPQLEAGDLVVYRPIVADQLRPGAVIIFERPGVALPITHRLLAVAPTPGGRLELTTKGDANPSVDPIEAIVESRQQVWQVRSVLPGWGTAFTQVTSGHGVPFVAGLELLVLCFGRAARLAARPKAGHRRSPGRAPRTAQQHPALEQSGTLGIQ